MQRTNKGRRSGCGWYVATGQQLVTRMLSDENCCLKGYRARRSEQITRSAQPNPTDTESTKNGANPQTCRAPVFRRVQQTSCSLEWKGSAESCSSHLCRMRERDDPPSYVNAVQFIYVIILNKWGTLQKPRARPQASHREGGRV